MKARLELPALDGANPLGFLAALGTLATLHGAGQTQAKLGWRRVVKWEPVLEGITTDDPKQLSDVLAQALRGATVASAAEKTRKVAQEAVNAAKKALKDKKEELKKRRLRGEKRKQAVQTEIKPLEEAFLEKRQVWLVALRNAVPRPELALGQHLECTADEFRELATDWLESTAYADREVLDILAALGSDACTKERSHLIQPTPFCFITGSGHQYFLDTVRALMGVVTEERVYAALFSPWVYQDETLSMRWDPIEDRRYALMDRDPTASDNKPRTVWMANLLAYRGLVFFPVAPTTKGLGTTSWIHHDGELAFTWPLWDLPMGPDAIRSLLQMPELSCTQPNRTNLRVRGVLEIFRSRRIKVGDGANFKLNFSPARSL